jgi:hypothetical protein
MDVYRFRRCSFIGIEEKPEASFSKNGWHYVRNSNFRTLGFSFRVRCPRSSLSSSQPSVCAGNDVLECSSTLSLIVILWATRRDGMVWKSIWA